MWSRRLFPHGHVDRIARLKERDVAWIHVALVILLVSKSEEQTHGKAGIERQGVSDLNHLGTCQLCVVVLLQMFHLAPSDNRIDVEILVKYVGKRHARDLRLLLLGDVVQRSSDSAALIITRANITALAT